MFTQFWELARCTWYSCIIDNKVFLLYYLWLHVHMRVTVCLQETK